MSTKFEVAMRLVEQMSKSLRASHRKLSRYRKAIDAAIQAQADARQLRLQLEEMTLSTIAEQEKEFESLKSSYADARQLRIQLEETQKSHRDLFKAHADTLATIAEKEKEIASVRDDLAERLCEAVTIAQGTSQRSNIWFAHFLGLTGVEFNTGSDANHEVAAVRNEIRRIVSEDRAARLDNESGRQQIADDLATEEQERDIAREHARELEKMLQAKANATCWVTICEERDAALDRSRRAAQILIAEFGADGPMSVDEAAERAVRVHRDTVEAAAEAERNVAIERVCAVVASYSWEIGSHTGCDVKIGDVNVCSYGDDRDGPVLAHRIRDEIRKAAKGGQHGNLDSEAG